VETNPSKDFCLKERDRLKFTVEGIKGRFEFWKKNNAPKDADPKDLKSIFARVTGLSEVKKSLKTINYILE
jgi:hypothetical protein